MECFVNDLTVSTYVRSGFVFSLDRVPRNDIFVKSNLHNSTHPELNSISFSEDSNFIPCRTVDW